jgi:hypothetical protein
MGKEADNLEEREAIAANESASSTRPIETPRLPVALMLQPPMDKTRTYAIIQHREIRADYLGAIGTLGHTSTGIDRSPNQ